MWTRWANDTFTVVKPALLGYHWAVYSVSYDDTGLVRGAGKMRRRGWAPTRGSAWRWSLHHIGEPHGRHP